MLMQRFGPFMVGMVVMGCIVAWLYFLKFYRETHDRLFLFFAAAFWLEGMNRTILAFTANPREADPVIYLLRLAAYGLLLLGIWDKNRRAN
jgi:hypothetical protein